MASRGAALVFATGLFYAIVVWWVLF